MALIAAIQIASTGIIQENMDIAVDLIKQAAKQGAQLAVLPEEFATIGLTFSEKEAAAERLGKGPLQTQLAEVACREGIWVVGGTIPLYEPLRTKLFSSSLVWNSEGKRVARYDKVHLFDVTVAGQTYNESEKTEAGKRIVVLETPVGKMGMAICYDVRFPELFRALVQEGCDFFVLPSAFTLQTGQAHWEILLRARAIENLCYMVASAQAGERADGRATYGHSMIISPWGEIQACLEKGNGIILAEVALDKVHAIRKQFPVLRHTQPFVIKKLSKGDPK